jgi:hypothetical protein
LKVDSTNFSYSSYAGFKGNGTLTNCNFTYNKFGVDGRIIANNCNISNNQTGAFCYFNSKISNSIIDSNSIKGIVVFTNDTIVDNKIEYNGIGLDVSNGASFISRNYINNNNIGIKLGSPNCNLYCNRICSNVANDVYVSTTSNVNISQNYWCTADSATVSSHVFDGYDNVSLGLADFTPIDTFQCYLYPTCSSFFYVYPDSNAQYYYWAVNMATGIPPLSYLWNWGDGNTSNTAYPSHTYNNPGYYYISLTITDSINCEHSYTYSDYFDKNIDQIIYINVISPAQIGIQEIKNNLHFSLFPNPFSSSATLMLSAPVLNAKLSIYDMIGKEVKRIENLNGKEIIIQKENLKTGMYFFKIEDNKGFVGNGKFVVE